MEHTYEYTLSMHKLFSERHFKQTINNTWVTSVEPQLRCGNLVCRGGSYV